MQIKSRLSKSSVNQDFPRKFILKFIVDAKPRVYREEGAIDNMIMQPNSLKTIKLPKQICLILIFGLVHFSEGLDKLTKLRNRHRLLFRGFTLCSIFMFLVTHCSLLCFLTDCWELFMLIFCIFGMIDQWNRQKWGLFFLLQYFISHRLQPYLVKNRSFIVPKLSNTVIFPTLCLIYLLDSFTVLLLKLLQIADSRHLFSFTLLSSHFFYP